MGFNQGFGTGQINGVGNVNFGAAKLGRIGCDLDFEYNTEIVSNIKD